MYKLYKPQHTKIYLDRESYHDTPKVLKFDGGYTKNINLTLVHQGF